MNVCVKLRKVLWNNTFIMYEAYSFYSVSLKNTGCNPLKLILQCKSQFGKILLVNRWVSKEFQVGESRAQVCAVR